jgi:hypothetical protein
VDPAFAASRANKNYGAAIAKVSVPLYFPLPMHLFPRAGGEAALEVVEEEPGNDDVVGAFHRERGSDVRHGGGGERSEVVEPPGAAGGRAGAVAALGVARESERRALRGGARWPGVRRGRDRHHMGPKRGHGPVKRACGVGPQEQPLALLDRAHDAVPRPVRHLLQRPVSPTRTSWPDASMPRNSAVTSSNASAPPRKPRITTGLDDAADSLLILSQNRARTPCNLSHSSLLIYSESICYKQSFCYEQNRFVSL